MFLAPKEATVFLVSVAVTVEKRDVWASPDLDPGRARYVPTVVSIYGEWRLGLFTRRPCPPVAVCSQGGWAIRVYDYVFVATDEK